MQRDVYDSVTTVAIYKKGKSDVKMQRLTLKNGKGFKEVVYKKNGRVTRKARKPLTKSEVSCIRRCRFKPKLFKECNQECQQQN
jgi:hypothetical protein